jgi:hypothetical protein
VVQWGPEHCTIRPFTTKGDEMLVHKFNRYAPVKAQKVYLRIHLIEKLLAEGKTTYEVAELFNVPRPVIISTMRLST